MKKKFILFTFAFSFIFAMGISSLSFAVVDDNSTNQLNTGDVNTGDVNTGDVNTGDVNTGDVNTGDVNTGDVNTGDVNTGDVNTGDVNTGDVNTGDVNTGDVNTGDVNTGDVNTGDVNTGDVNTGDVNTGDVNTGNVNTGNVNTGNVNTGNVNTGNVNTGNVNTGNVNTGNVNTGNVNTGNVNTGDIGGSPYDNELNNAYLYARKIGITTKNTIIDADMMGGLIRAHMAKMLSNFAINVLGKTPDTSKECNFVDMEGQSDEMKLYAIKACQLGLMGLDKDGNPVKNFNPNKGVNRAQFGTVLSRAIRGTGNNGGTIYYEKHLKALNETNPKIMKNINPNMMEVRGYVMIMMQRVSNMFKK